MKHQDAELREQVDQKEKKCEDALWVFAVI